MKLFGENLGWFLDFTLMTFLIIQTADAQTPNECNKVQKINAKISTFLELEGFHRKLTFVIYQPAKMTNFILSDDVIVKLKVPSGLYVDPYQLTSWQRLQNNTVEYHINETINVENPEYKSMPFTFTLKIKLTNEITNISIPIHARYHKPQYCKDKNSIQVTLDKPEIYFNVRSELENRQGVLDICGFKRVKVNYKTMEALTFNIPVGCLEHLNFVIVTTIFVTSLGTLWLGFHVLRNK